MKFYHLDEKLPPKNVDLLVMKEGGTECHIARKDIHCKVCDESYGYLLWQLKDGRSVYASVFPYWRRF